MINKNRMKAFVETPIRVLRVVSKMDFGGLETIIMNTYRRIDRTKIQFDFIVHYPEEGKYDKEIRELGGKIYVFPLFNGMNYKLYRDTWKRFLKEHTEYKIIHGHVAPAAWIYLSIAKQYNLITIFHSNDTKPKSFKKASIKQLLQTPLRAKNAYVDYKLACSIRAGKWMYGNDKEPGREFFVVPNGIDTKKFVFSEETRNRVRMLLGFDSDFIIGHVGRFDDAKNQQFIVEVFNEFLKRRNEAKLVLIGTGIHFNEIQDKVNHLGISSNVLLLGLRNDVNELMQAMDFLIFPSIYESFGNVLVEAQAAGLKCLVSTNVSTEVRLTDQIEYLSLSENAQTWADKICSMAQECCDREKSAMKIKCAGYDVITSTKWYEEFYQKILKGDKYEIKCD